MKKYLILVKDKNNKETNETSKQIALNISCIFDDKYLFFKYYFLLNLIYG